MMTYEHLATCHDCGAGTDGSCCRGEGSAYPLTTYGITRQDRADDLHGNGVHVECRLSPLVTGSAARRRSDGTSRVCPLAGKVERFHSHDHDGPLMCGCDDFSTF